MPRAPLVLLLALAACRDKPLEDRRAEVEALCDDYCPRRVACVADNWADGDEDTCLRLCKGDDRLLEDNVCGEAAFASLECLAAATCEDLPAAVRAAVGDGDAPCSDEQQALRDDCSFTFYY